MPGVASAASFRWCKPARTQGSSPSSAGSGVRWQKVSACGCSANVAPDRAPPRPRATHWWSALVCSAARRSARGVLQRDNRVWRRGGHRCCALRGHVAAGEVRARTRERVRAGACMHVHSLNWGPGTHSGPVLCRQGAALADGRRCARNSPRVPRGLCATGPAVFPHTCSPPRLRHSGSADPLIRDMLCFVATDSSAPASGVALAAHGHHTKRRSLKN